MFVYVEVRGQLGIFSFLFLQYEFLAWNIIIILIITSFLTMEPFCCLHTLLQIFTINLWESEKKTIIYLSNSSLNLQVSF